ncbi:hypothetical protein KDW_58920 [Dictyobacter vulcani]|uniref:Lanthionine synthetase n=1 Tax=Dictyobacter vulcani TaxID=2607529 RepID=A0A5J4KYX8_9CHLR|nr:hypothetical protein KDW_58920 [Dictyobacter vulcani]
MTRERLLAVACRIGDRLCTLATGDALGVNWIGATFTPENQWLLTATKADLYAGNTGIIFFLSYLGIITGNTKYSDVVEAAYLTMYRQVVRCEAPLQAVGLFEGLGSVIYLLSHLGAIWNDYSMLTEAHRLAKRLPDLIQKDTAFDLLSGSAGCILSLLSLYHVFPEAEILSIACMCGDHLLENARPAKDGLAWTSSVGVEPRTGMSHGTAGCSLSLFALAAISGEERFHKLALATLAYERSVFSPQAQNWPDLLEAEESVEATWCHGAPGIALSRLASLRYIDDEQIRAEIAVALKTTVAHFGRNHSLCHGDLGNLETLLLATQSLDDAWCHEQFNYFRGVILDSIETDGWLTATALKSNRERRSLAASEVATTQQAQADQYCRKVTASQATSLTRLSSTALSIETPGLMTGLAGIGYELLRLAEPERVPSVLVAAPPFTKIAQR